MIRIRPERPADFPDIDELVRESFLKGTPYSDGQAEVALIHEIREKGYYLPEGAFVAERDGELAGHFMLSRLPLSEDAAGNFDPGRVRENILLLAPVAVKFACLYQGIGTEMLSQGVKWAKDRGFRALWWREARIITIVLASNPPMIMGFCPRMRYNCPGPSA